jgi:polyphosphate kinase 2 (PPK2 family)
VPKRRGRRAANGGARSEARKPPKNYDYVEELTYLQIELIKMQECVRHNRLRMCVIFEGRDAAGKGASSNALQIR